MKVIEKIRAASEEEKTIFSFEYFLPRTDNGVENLLNRIDRMVTTCPSFCDITWRAGTSNEQRTLDVAEKMQNKVSIETMMHLTCTGMPVERIDYALDTIKSNGIQNVLALRGDPIAENDKSVQVPGEFTCALDLVNHIRAKYGEYFGISVAGYPEAHPDEIHGDDEEYFKSEDYLKAYQSDLAYLKRKVDAGADLVVTQLFYDTDKFLKFVNDCRQIGITCPIVPGIMPIFNYARFSSFTGRYKTKIPSELKAALESIKDNDEAVKAYGIHLATEMCKKILAYGIKELHFYTLNREETTLAVLMNLGFIDEANISRSIPLKSITNGLLVKEEAKPILSSSHISKTQGSDQNQQEQHGNSINASNGALAGNLETLKSVEETNGVEKSRSGSGRWNGDGSFRMTSSSRRN